MIFKIFAYSFSAIALLSLIGAWLKRSQRVSFAWAMVSAAIAAGSAFGHVFWPVACFGLMALWALFTTLSVMTTAWRMKDGLTLAIALGAVLSIFPTFHDEVLCSQRNSKGPEIPIKDLRPACPQVIDALSAEVRDAQQKKAVVGDAGLSRFLLANIPFRMVRGLDLKGGLRLVYTVDVEEAVKDKRDRYYDSIRAALTKAFKLSESDNPNVEEMKKLAEHVALSKPVTKVDRIILTFKKGADSTAKIDDEFLVPFLRELSILRSSDGKLVTFRIRSEVVTEIRIKAVGQAKETINRRIDGMGVKEAAISVRDEDIIVEIPGSKEKDFENIREIIAETARLEFKLLDDATNFFDDKYVKAAPDTLPKGLIWETENAPLGKTESGSTKTQSNNYARLDALEGETMERVLKRFKEWTATLPIDEDHEIGFGKVYEVDQKTEEYKAVGYRTYYLRAKAEITGDMVRDAQAQADRSDTGMGGWYVNMTFTPLGGEIFEKITGENVKRRFAIILDSKVESSPVIQEAIGGGTARITMGAGGIQDQLRDARKLELVLRSGALPAPISPSNEQNIGPSLGNDSIDQGMKAGAIGALLVLVLMVMTYRRAGLIANTAVVFNLVLQIAVLSMFSASMTLPGIAGLALTVGVAVDANVLINERIKEELAAGKSAGAAVAIGYEKAFTAIIDGNATTLIAGLILAQYGTGPIKGFAITLIIGMLTNLFTGVIVTRLFFEFWVRGRRETKLSIGA